MRLPWKILATTLALAGIIFLATTFWSNPSGGYLASDQLPDSVSYNFDIRPILSDKCFACHGPDANKRKGDLRMDDPVSAFAALKEHPRAHALVAGKPELSYSFLPTPSNYTPTVMPPPPSPLKLTPLHIPLNYRWSDPAASPYKPSAFAPPRHPSHPVTYPPHWPPPHIATSLPAHP